MEEKIRAGAEYDLIVIGSGPGGYVAAIKAAQLGKKTAIIESREIGGTCLNRGCIPTKTLMHSAHLYSELKNIKEYGISIENAVLEPERLWDRKNSVVERMRKGIISLLEANQITILHGKAQITGKDDTTDTVLVKVTSSDPLNSRLAEVSTQEGEVILKAERVLLATGSKPLSPDISGIGLPGVMTSDELLENRKLFRKLLIIGGGVIGIEFATLYRELGCEVELIEYMDRILPSMDKEISQSIAMNLKRKGVLIHTKSEVRAINLTSEGLTCEFSEKGEQRAVTAEGVLISVGRRAAVEGLFAADLDITMDGTYLSVKENFETSIPGIYAIGDAIRGQALAHLASAQGIAAVEEMYGQERSVDLSVVPACVYTSPEVATVGLSEEKAIEAGYELLTGKYPMLGNGRTILSSGERGFIKVIADRSTGRLLGAVLLCDRATDLVGEFAIAIANGLTLQNMAAVIRPHPTFSEAITEAVEDTEGMAIHLMPRKIK